MIGLKNRKEPDKKSRAALFKAEFRQRMILGGVDERVCGLWKRISPLRIREGMAVPLHADRLVLLAPVATISLIYKFRQH